MLRILKSTILLCLILLSSCAQISSISRNIASENASCLKLVKQILHQDRPFSFEKDLDNKLFAVHLTNFLPNNGIIEANSTNRARFAATLHFSLGEPVISHGNGKWTNKKYAILVPIKYLKDQMLNIFVQDTFILGSFQLPKETIILIPNGSPLPKGYNGIVRNYENNNIVEATKNLIKEEGGVALNANSPFVKNEITIQGEAVDPKVILKKYFDEIPFLTYELHYTTLYGAVDTTVYSILGEWLAGLTPSNPLSASNLQARLMILQKLILEIDKRVSVMNLATIASTNYNSNRKALDGLINLIQTEIEFQNKYQKSFLNSKSHASEIWENRFDKKNLMYILSDNLLDFESSSQIEITKISSSELIRGLSFLDYYNLKKIFHHPDIYTQLSKYDIHKELFLAGLNSSNSTVPLEELAHEFELAIKNMTDDYQYHVLINRLDLIESGALRKRLIQDPQINLLIENYRIKLANKKKS